MKAKVKIHLIGGLGNQLFGICFAYLIKQFVKAEVCVSGELIPFGSNATRKLEIQNLDFVKKNPVKIIDHRIFMNRLLKKSRLLRKVVWQLIRIRVGAQRMDLMSFWNKKAKIDRKIEFLDYFADWFFPEYLRELGIVEFNRACSLEAINSGKIQTLLDKNHKTCFVHVRLGDYLKFPEIYTILEDRYYEAAISLIDSSKEWNEALNIVVVTESEPELKYYLPRLHARANRIISRSSKFTDLEIFEIMCESEYLVAANSTYSLWAAWFGLRKRRMTIVPCEDSEKAKENGLLALNWTVLDARSGVELPKLDGKLWLQKKATAFKTSLGHLFQDDWLL